MAKIRIRRCVGYVARKFLFETFRRFFREESGSGVHLFLNIFENFLRCSKFLKMFDVIFGVYYLIYVMEGYMYQRPSTLINLSQFWIIPQWSLVKRKVDIVPISSGGKSYKKDLGVNSFGFLCSLKSLAHFEKCKMEDPIWRILR